MLLLSDRRAVTSLEYGLLAATVAVSLISLFHGYAAQLGNLLPHLTSTGRL